MIITNHDCGSHMFSCKVLNTTHHHCCGGGTIATIATLLIYQRCLSYIHSTNKPSCMQMG